MIAITTLRVSAPICTVLHADHNGGPAPYASEILPIIWLGKNVKRKGPPRANDNGEGY